VTAYKRWCLENCLSPCSAQEFSTELRTSDFLIKKAKIDGTTVRCVFDCAIENDFQPEKVAEVSELKNHRQPQK
jgi:hypothetical protein